MKMKMSISVLNAHQLEGNPVIIPDSGLLILQLYGEAGDVIFYFPDGADQALQWLDGLEEAVRRKDRREHVRRTLRITESTP